MTYFELCWRLRKPFPFATGEPSSFIYLSNPSLSSVYVLKRYNKYERYFSTTLQSRPILNESHVKHVINRGYHTAARRYDFYLQVVKTIFYERAQRLSKYCF
jgi:hypothetical protein